MATSLLLCACPPNERIARVSDAHVVAAGKSGGGIAFRPQPLEGKPLVEGFAASARCTPAEELLKLLGPACSHETENPAPMPASAAVDDLEPGKPARSREVRWYCGGQLDVRVVFEACDTNADGKTDGIVPVEVAVAIHPTK
ncbi:MAG: hypothetical protein ACOY0T_27860 [Myxococcota bacterium]